MKLTVRDLLDQRREKLEAAEVLVQDSEGEERDFTPEELRTYESLMAAAKSLGERAARLEETQKAQAELGARKAPAYNNKTRLGDDEVKATAYYIRTGDLGAIETRASNDTDMNVGTDADGGYAVPTGHFQGIIARRDEGLLEKKLKVREIPGKGTTVNVPVDNEADGEFVSTNEAAAFDRDAPALDSKAMTLLWYTKKVELSYQLLDGEDSKLLAFLEDFIGRGQAKTLNNNLLTEVASNGTSLKTFASATAIAAGEPEDIVGNNDLSNYLDDGGSVGWVMRSATHWDIKSLTGNARQYAAPHGTDPMNLLGYDVAYSAKAAAVAASAKSVYFGNWYYVGVRHAPSMRFLRDPYSKAANGQVLLHYYFGNCYDVLQAEAVGYGVHPSA